MRYAQKVMDFSLIFFAVVAVIVVFRLISVLGTRTGHQRDPEARSHAPASEREALTAQRLPDPEAAPSEAHAKIPGFAALHDADPAFDPDHFLAGARSAYEMIIDAFAAGDLRGARRFLADDVHAAFRQAIDARTDAERRLDLKFIGIESATISHGAVEGGRMSVSVDFASNQVRVSRDREGNVVDGDPNRIDLVRERWTFERNVRARDPNWVLAATGAVTPSGA